LTHGYNNMLGFATCSRAGHPATIAFVAASD
jgi:hypothetical protein